MHIQEEIEGYNVEEENYRENSVEAFDKMKGDSKELDGCILQKLLYSTKSPIPTQMHAIFKTRCTINKKVSEVIIDGGSSENVIS